MLTAAALSVTVGVLIGIVLILGSKARQSASGSTPTSTVATETTASTVPGSAEDLTGAQISVLPAASMPPTSVTTSSIPAPASTTGSTATDPAAATASSRPAPARRTPTTATSRVAATPPAIVHTTLTIGPPPRPVVPRAVSTASASAPTVTSVAPPPATRTVIAPRQGPPHQGAPAPGRPCPALGLKAKATGGFTVYCQRDFRNGSFAWRAVVNGGGCLSKRMTGIGTDGQLYRCRPDTRGLDHWRRA